MAFLYNIIALEYLKHTARVVVGTCILASVGLNLYKLFKDDDKKIEALKNDILTELTVLKETAILSNNLDSDDSTDELDDDINEESASESEQFDQLSITDTNNDDSDADITSASHVDIEDINKESYSNVKIEKDVKKSNTVRLRKKQKHVTGDQTFSEEQITDKLRSDLSKQGYRLIETHAAVKMCRWTKNSMRGRGGCYKHTFYGIKSYQCMEMTPNLACASKCTFCWRHHKNPVGTEWKWKMDEPSVIVEQALKNHLEMIKQMRGVPGVVKERFEESQNVRHCALSLVGEPIFYPRINELLEILHARRISTFLVTNAQFPDALENLIPITQLYVSIDAPNKAALRKIDRPLYKDFWERYIDCLKIIKEKKQRTVFRLTLVAKANMEDIEGYAELIRIGQPDFIEIKGVTYCGTSKANKLTMENVPWHEQVVEFTQDLASHLPQDMYQIACEHSHSNCTLIANTKFLINGIWHTWIDYEKFFQLVAGGTKEFNSLDYVSETPDWAIFGSKEAGFDPEHRRWIRREHKLKLLEERLSKNNAIQSDTRNDCLKTVAV